MTRLFISTLVVLLFANSCTKKSAPVNCYNCASNDSVVSNIPALNKAHYIYIYGTKCGFTDAQVRFYQRVNTKVDTMFFRNDTLEVEYWTMNCDIE